jgi:signal transduction histidine kinase
MMKAERELYADEAERQQLSRRLLVAQEQEPALDDHGVIPALEDYLKRWSEQFGVQAELHANGFDTHRLGGEVDIAVYRIVQEALQNIAKHARARSVAVLLDRHTEHLSLIVEDDGDGFDVDGLIGMHDRAMQLGGTFDIESLPGRGTTVAVRLPLASSRETDRV